MATMARVFRTAFLNKLSPLSSSCSSSSLASFSSSPYAKEAEVVGSRRLGLDILGAKDYEDYRKSRYGEITHKALLVDAVGTLVVPAQPMAQVSFFRFLGVCCSFVRSDGFLWLGGLLDL